MTIQISVLIWTILCFLLLVLILRKLLFEPVLKLLDARRERLQKAVDKKAEYERLAGEYEARRKEQEAALLAQRRLQEKQEIEAIRADSKEALEAARVERLRRVDDYRLKAEEESERLLGLLSAHGSRLALSFADSLLKEQ